MKLESPKKFNCIIIGAGPAGLTAAIYALRANLSVAIIENDSPGGKMTKTYIIDNYPAFQKIKGVNLSLKMFKQVKNLGGVFFYKTVKNIELNKQKNKVVYFEDSYLICDTVVVSSGTFERELNVKGEKEYFSRGVSTCAVCDGSLYKNKDIAVVGGGLSAIEEALYLLKFARKLYLIHRRQFFRAPENIVNKLKNKKQVTFFIDWVVKEIKGKDSKVNEVIIENVKTKKTKSILISCIFPYIGQIPNTTFLKHFDILDEAGFIIIDRENFSTKIPGIFAAGDVIQKKLRQVSTAVGDGANAGQSVISFIDNLYE